MKLSRMFGVATAAVIVVGLTAAPAWAAPPVNDTVDNAISVDVGFDDSVDTTEATTDAVDAQLNETCGAPATDASVWYLLEPSADVTVIIDVSASNYPAGVAVGVGTPGSLTTVACGPGTVLLEAFAGETYYVLAFDDQSDGGGNGGQLEIAFIETQAPTVTFAVSRNARLDGSGNAVLHGTYTCEGGNSIQISGDLVQLQGFGSVRAQFALVDRKTCDGTRHKWQTVARAFGPDDFRPGRALVTSFGFACGEFLCADGFGERTVQLRSPLPVG